MRRTLSLVFASLLFVASACGSGSESQTQEQGGSGQSKQVTYAEGNGNGIDAIKVTGQNGAEPKLSFETPFTADQTNSKVLVEGDGPKLNAGQNMVVAQYVGVNGRNGKKFDSSWQGQGGQGGQGGQAGGAQGAQSMPFPLETGGLIPGFVQGLDGQTVGSRVLIAMQPKDGFAQGNEQAGIKKDDSLVFVVDIKESGPLVKQANGEAVDPDATTPTIVTDDQQTPTGIEVPDGGPGEKTQVTPVVRGDGAKVSKQDTVSFHYLAAGWSDGKVLDSSWKREQPATVPAAQASQSIPGLTEALVGQTVGSRVVLVAPKPFAEQPEAAKQLGIEPDESLVFVVDIRGAVS